jgi:hypothetical protein
MATRRRVTADSTAGYSPGEPAMKVKVIVLTWALERILREDDELDE